MTLNFTMLRRWPEPTVVGRSRSPLVVVHDMPAALRAVDGKARRVSGVGAKGADWNPSSEDTMGDILEVLGLDTTRWRQGGSPLCLDHDQHTQIGNGLRDAIVGDEWRVELELYPPGTTAAADQAWREIQAGGRTGLSIGFQPLEFERRTTARGGEGIHFTKSLLLELSSVILPACPSCLVTQRCAKHAAAPVGAHACECRGACGCESNIAVEIAAPESGIAVEILSESRWSR
jgi:hypothetical protein